MAGLRTLLLAAAAQPCQAYLMSRAGLTVTNAAFRDVAAKVIQPSVRTTVPLPETLRSLQIPASIGGMITDGFGKCGVCVEESQRNGTDLDSCGKFTVLALPTAAAAEADERPPVTGWHDGAGLRVDSGDIVVSPRPSSAPVGGMQRLGIPAAAPVRARVVAQASQALGGWPGRGQGGGTGSPPAGGGGPPQGGAPPGGGPPGGGGPPPRGGPPAGGGPPPQGGPPGGGGPPPGGGPPGGGPPGGGPPPRGGPPQGGGPPPGGGPPGGGPPGMNRGGPPGGMPPPGGANPDPNPSPNPNSNLKPHTNPSLASSMLFIGGPPGMNRGGPPGGMPPPGGANPDPNPNSDPTLTHTLTLRPNLTLPYLTNAVLFIGGPPGMNQGGSPGGMPPPGGAKPDPNRKPNAHPHPHPHPKANPHPSLTCCLIF